VSLTTHLQLGRVSNLPTVWSNVLAAGVLGGAPLDAIAPLLLALLGFSALYTGGMYLNDACDADIDARERPERPIPSGRITRTAVLRATLGWFVAGLVCIGVARALSPIPAGIGWLPAALALLACIVAYDLHHKGNRFGPMLMAGCRALVYLAAALTLAGTVGAAVLTGAVLAFAWIAGLTALAKRESGPSISRWPWPLIVLALPTLYASHAWQQSPIVVPLIIVGILLIGLARFWMRRRSGNDFPAAVGLLIAGMSLVDALVVAAHGHLGPASLCIVCFVATLGLQRRLSGT